MSNICFVYACMCMVRMLMIWTCSLVHNMKHSSSNKMPKKLSTSNPPFIMKKMFDVCNHAHCMGFPKYKGHTHTHKHVLIPTTHVVCSRLIVGSKTTTTTTKPLLPFDWTRLKRNHPCCYCSMYIFFFFPSLIIQE
jgi:hypothetical protein